MTDSKRDSNESKLGHFSSMRELANLVLNGPRAAMFPDDPTGLNLWLEPVVRLKCFHTGYSKSQSLIAYTIPNCLERNPTSPVMVRHAIWDAKKDKELVLSHNSTNAPTVSTIYKQIPTECITPIDQLLRGVDDSLKELPFTAEGLDLNGASGFRALPENAIIGTKLMHYALRRQTRFSYLEYRWIPMEGNWSKLDKAWTELFDAFIAVCEGSDAATSIPMVEKYDIEPLAYTQKQK